MDFSTLLVDCEVTDDPFVLDLSELLRRLRGISDHRHRRGLRYPLRLLLSISILAKMAGHHYPLAIAEWARLRTDELCTLLGVRRGKMPSLKTWDRVFAGVIDPDQREQVVSEFLREQVQDQSPATGLRSIAMDGKTLRGTIRIGRSNGVHLLAIYLPKEGVVLAQAEIGVKTNELGAAAPLLAQVDLHGMVLTGDAMFTQRELCMQVIKGGGAYLWKVKNN